MTELGPQPSSLTRLPTGIAGFDRILQGGFFDPAPIGHTLHYLSGYSVLLTEGLPGLLKLLRRVIRDQEATILVLDGLTNAEALASTPLELKQFLHNLHAFTEISGCTTFLL